MFQNLSAPRADCADSLETRFLQTQFCLDFILPPESAGFDPEHKSTRPEPRLMTPNEVYSLIERKRRRPWQNEEEVRQAWVSALERGLDIDLDSERQRRDSSYNNVFIEFKAPGLFNGSTSSAKFREATEQRLLKYIRQAAPAQQLAEEDYIGIAIDGEHICFAQILDGKIHPQHLLPFSPQSVAMVMEALRGEFRRPVTAEHLIEDFGHDSIAAVGFMQALSDALARGLKTQAVSKIRMLFEEWRALYGQVADLSREQTLDIDRVLHFVWRGAAADKMSGRLFVIHTYNSILIKLLAAEIVSAYGLSSRLHPAQEMAAGIADDKALLQRLKLDIEDGGIFLDARIKGFVEEAIFSWYLDACDDAKSRNEIVAGLRAILAKLTLYRTDRLERTRDVLRDFYQDLVPQTLRKSLGEFYTPDWLVEYTVAQSHAGNWLSTRALDPTCGSGSFLIELIRRKRAEAKNLDPASLIDCLCHTVWGFDLNPLAVQTARVNFLMEIADLLRACPGKAVEIPVLLADAIYSPARNPEDDESVVKYAVGSTTAALTITLPAQLALDRTRLDAVFAVMAEQVEEDREFKRAWKALLSQGLVTPEESIEWAPPLEVTYDQVLSLHRRTWNGIWFRIVRNFFWSATAGRFDVIIGNPPWVRWSKLPEVYRERVKPTCQQYDIFSKTPHHGGNELDISSMITYTTADKWLRSGGRLAFVITQTVFQNPSSSGFRNFHIREDEHLRPISVDDLKALKPFADADNKTAVAVFEKGSELPVFPVPYRLWQPEEGQTRSIPTSLGLQDVVRRVRRIAMEAHQVDGVGSPWAILRPGRMLQLEKLAGSSTWVEGRKGITTDLNGVYFIPIIKESAQGGLVQIRTRPEAGKKDIGSVRTAWIEPDLLYPLIKGASDFGACRFHPRDELFALVPNGGIRKQDYEDAEVRLGGLPGTKKYFGSFRAELEDRSTWRGRMPGAPYYAVYNVGAFTFKPWKVVWAEMSGKFAAAVAHLAEVPLMGNRPYVPDHKVYFVALDDESTAYYLCGLLNASMVGEFVESHNISIQVGDVFKHMNLPPYNAKSTAHKALAKAAEKAHVVDEVQHAVLLEQVRAAADAILEAWSPPARKAH